MSSKQKQQLLANELYFSSDPEFVPRRTSGKEAGQQRKTSPSSDDATDVGKMDAQSAATLPFLDSLSAGGIKSGDVTACGSEGPSAVNPLQRSASQNVSAGEALDEVSTSDDSLTSPLFNTDFARLSISGSTPLEIGLYNGPSIKNPLSSDNQLLSFSLFDEERLSHQHEQIPHSSIPLPTSFPVKNDLLELPVSAPISPSSAPIATKQREEGNEGVSTISTVKQNENREGPVGDGKSVVETEESGDEAEQVPICRYYLSGNCFRGNRCKFRHEKISTSQKKNTVTRILHDTFAAYPTAESLIGKVDELRFSKRGCQILQQLLDERDASFVAVIYSELFRTFSIDSTERYGNYLCQKLIEKLDDARRISLLQSLSGAIILLSTNAFGTRVVQKLISCSTTVAEHELLAKCFSTNVLTLLLNRDGGHALEELLRKLPPKTLSAVLAAFRSRECLLAASCDKTGCCSLQRCIGSLPADEWNAALSAISALAKELMDDQFGNYVIQYALGEGFDGLVTSAIKGDVIRLAKGKYSANVIEKLIKRRHLEIIDEIVYSDELQSLAKDKYGIYVIQACFTYGSFI